MKGFTLLELMVVLTIVSILTLTAVPEYSAHKARAFDMRAQSDLRSVILAQESYFLDHEHYLECIDDTCTSLPGIASLSEGVSLSVRLPGDGRVIALASHLKGSGRTFEWDSRVGKIAVLPGSR